MRFAQVATLPVVAITAWEALYGHACLGRGDYLLVQGRAGRLGHIGIQLGKLLGAHVAATVSTGPKAEIARRLGADHVIMYRNENVAEAIQAWTGKDGADVVFDTVGDAVFSQSVDLLTDHGRLVTAAYPTAWPKADIFWAALKNVQIAFEAMGHSLRSHELRVKQTEILETVATYADDGYLEVILDRTYPLAKAGEAQQALDAGQVTGKIALEIPH